LRAPQTWAVVSPFSVHVPVRVAHAAARAMAFPALVLKKGFQTSGSKQWTQWLPRDFEAALSANDASVTVAAASVAEAARADAAAQLAAADGVASPTAAGAGVLGNVWALARDAAGCRLVQGELEDGDDSVRRAVAKGFEGKVSEAMECPHANHVLQKCCIMLRPSEMQFILDELDSRPEGLVVAMQHKYGCRIVKRLLECGSREQVRRIAGNLLDHWHAVASHPYGTFVAQHLFYHADEEQQAALFTELQADVQDMCRSSHGAAVVHVALCQGDDSQVRSLCKNILAVPGLLAQMGCVRHGCPATIELVGMLRDLDAALHQAARDEVAAHTAELGACRYGRQVLVALGMGPQPAVAANKAVVAGKRGAQSADAAVAAAVRAGA